MGSCISAGFLYAGGSYAADEVWNNLFLSYLGVFAGRRAYAHEPIAILLSTRGGSVCSWAFWSCVWFVIALAQNLQDTKHPWYVGSSLQELGHLYLRFVFIQSVYWFVPNFFICLALVLALYKRVPDYVQGPVFLALSLFYGINTYLRVIPSRHTSALFGFVFYLWLGSFAYHHRASLNGWIAKISRMQLATYTGVAAIFALVEFHMLQKLTSGDSFNTLRISNQAFSVLATLLIVKSKGALFSKMIDVRSETFGIFLIHPILLQVVQVVYARIPLSTRVGITANGSLPLFSDSVHSLWFIFFLSC